MALGRRWVAAVALVLVAGGCADDEPQPEFEPSAESSATISDTASPDPGPKPWEKKTEAGAVAFAEHWVAVFSEAMQTGNTDDLAALSSDGCETCANVIARVQEIHDGGGSYTSNGWRVLQAGADEQSGGADALVALRVLRTAESFRESADAPKQHNDASRASYSAHLKWTRGGWVMHRLDAVA